MKSQTSKKREIELSLLFYGYDLTIQRKDKTKNALNLQP